MKVAIIVFNGVQSLDVAGPLDVFAEANAFLAEYQQYEVSLVGLEAGNVTCSNGMQLSVPFGYRDLDTHFDLLLVAGGPQLPRSAPPSDHFLSWLSAQARNTIRFGSVCNGAFTLAHAGLLDGMEVTTHWADAALLAEQFPEVRVQPDKIFVRDGRLFTSAGVSAGIDLCLSLVSEDYGHEVAVRVAKRLVVYIQREGGQSQYSPYVGAGRDEDPIIKKVHQYVSEHIADTLSIEQLASAVSVSRRTFSRVFAKHAKVTPSAFVEQVRVDTARKLLEETDAPLKTVAFQCGFHNATQMRMTFSRRLSVTPKQYRTRFRGDVPTNAPEIEDIEEDALDIESTADRLADSALNPALALNLALESTIDLDLDLDSTPASDSVPASASASVSAPAPTMHSVLTVPSKRASSRKANPHPEVDPYAPHAIFRVQPTHQEHALL